MSVVSFRFKREGTRRADADFAYSEKLRSVKYKTLKVQQVTQTPFSGGSPVWKNEAQAGSGGGGALRAEAEQPAGRGRGLEGSSATGSTGSGSDTVQS